MTTLLTPSVLLTDVMTQIRAYLLAILPAATEVVQGQDNRVAQPVAANYAIMTPISMARLSTTIDDWDHSLVPPGAWPDSIEITSPTEIVIQLDIYGAKSFDNMQLVAATFRDAFGVDQINTTHEIAPLYAENAMQLPFLNGENQLEQRWSIKMHLQFNPVVSIGMDFFDAVTVIPKEVV